MGGAMDIEGDHAEGSGGKGKLQRVCHLGGDTSACTESR